MNILVTGCAGFIGFHFVKKLLNEGHNIVGIDSINDYYDVKIKKDRLKILKKISKKNFKFYKKDLCESKFLEKCFLKHKFAIVVHFAAQAGVRYSITNPESYIQNNIVAFNNVIENCRLFKIKHFVYASSSSVYGMNSKMPLTEEVSVDHPMQLYAATKRSNELVAHSYSSLFKIPSTGLRFFTVYGPWGRPDMSLFKFVKNILNSEPISVYNKGNHKRDFTYVDDIVNGVYLAMKKTPKYTKINSKKLKPNLSSAPFKIYNIGNGKPISLLSFINIIEKELNIKSKRKYLKLQAGDINTTHSDIYNIKNELGFSPKIDIERGIKSFVSWFKDYYKI